MADQSEARKAIRQKLFSSENTKPKSEVIDVFGTKVELRQPNLATILGAKEEKDRTRAMIQMLVNYCYVPGTDEKVFEPTDIDVILEWPFGEDFTRINKEIAKLTGVDVLEAEREMQEDPTSSQSTR